MRRALASFRIRLILLVLLTIFPALGLTLYTAAERREQDADQAEESELRIVRLVAGNQEELSEDTRRLLLSLAQLPVVRDRDSVACSALFADLLKQFPRYNNLKAVAPNGDVFCSALPLSGPLNDSDRPWFTRALESRDFVISNYQIDRPNGNSGIHFAYPVLDAGQQVRAVVTTRLDFNWLNQFAAQAQFPSGSDFTVRDRNGTVLMRYPDSEKWLGRSIPDTSIVQTILNQKSEGTAEIVGVDGITRLYAFTLLRGVPDESKLYVSLGIPRDIAFAEANRALARNLTVLGIVALLSLAAAWMGSELLILRRLKALVHTTQRLATGDLSARTGMRYGLGELSQLGRGFDQMAASLETQSAELRTSTERYRTIVDNAHDIIWTMDRHGSFTFANPRGEAVTGYKAADWIGKRSVSLVHPEDLPHVREVFLETLRGNSSSYEVRVLGKDHEWIPLSVNTAPVYEKGAVVGTVSFGRDITERMKAEKALRESEERFRAVAESANEAIVVAGSDHKIILWNKGAEQLFLYTEQEALGKPVTILIPEPYLTRHQEAVQRFFPTGESRVVGKTNEGQGLRKDGSKFPIEISLAAWEAAQGKFYSAIIRDITERKRAETEIKHNAARAEALLRVAARLNTQLELDALLRAVCEETQRALNVHAAALYLYDAERDALSIAADSGLPREFREHHHPTPRAQYEQFARRMGAVNTIPDAQAVPELPNADLVRALDIRTIAGATLLRDEELVGALSIYTFGAVREFSPDDLELLKGIAHQAALAIHNARLFTETRERAQQLGLLYDAGLTINRELDPRVQMEFLLKLAAKTVSADLAEFFAFDPITQAVAFQFGVGHAEEMFAPLRALGKPNDAENHLVAEVCRQRLPLNLPDVSADPRYVVVDPKMRAGLWVPILHEEQLRGVIAVLSSRLNAFSPQDERLLSLFANQAAVAMENARLLEETKERARQMEALHRIDHAITSSMNLHLTLDILLSQVIEHLRADAVDVLLLDSRSHALSFAAGRGFQTRALEHTRLRVGEGHAGIAALERRIVRVSDLAEADGGFARSRDLAREGFVSYVGVPLIAKGQVRGVLEIFQRARVTPDSNWQFFVEALAEQAAIAIQDAELFDHLERSNAELIAAYDATIEGWSRALDLRDKETEGHTQRVTELSLRLARAMGTGERELAQVRRGALLHDIGKMGVPDAILLKPDALSEQEWVIMRKHPVLAYEMLSPISFLRPALDIPYCHHEKWDGTGYPRGLKGEQIPFVARIFSVVDVWDALNSDRPYRKAWSAERVREYLNDLSGKYFDPKVVKAFLGMEGV